LHAATIRFGEAATRLEWPRDSDFRFFPLSGTICSATVFISPISRPRRRNARYLADDYADLGLIEAVDAAAGSKRLRVGLEEACPSARRGFCICTMASPANLTPAIYRATSSMKAGVQAFGSHRLRSEVRCRSDGARDVAGQTSSGAQPPGPGRGKSKRYGVSASGRI
jgi:hypothetical protein